MKAKLLISLFVALVVAQTLLSCSNTSHGTTEQQDVMGDRVNDTIKEQIVLESISTPIGDRGLYDVVGNVKSIDVGYKIEFDVDGILKETKKPEAKIVKTEDGIEYHIEIYDELSYDNIDLIYKYDKEGRCIRNGFNEDITYDTNNRITSYKCSYDGEDNEYTYMYDSEGFRSKQTIKTYSHWEESTTITTTTYKLLSKDDHGNWTKRQDNNGNIEERTIEYY